MFSMRFVPRCYKQDKSTAAVFLDIEKAFHITWHLNLVYKLSKLQFSISLVKLISSFLSQIKFRVLVEGEVSAQGFHKVPSCSPHYAV
jgi:hypothetical protein